MRNLSRLAVSRLAVSRLAVSRLSGPLLMAALGHLAIEFCNNYLPVLYPVLMSSLDLELTHVGTIALTVTTATTLTQPLFGIVSDRWGSTRLGALSVIWLALVMGMVGFATNYTALLILVALGSLGSAAFHPAGAAIATAHSGTRQGAAISIFSAGGNIGTALSPLWMAFAYAMFGLAGTATVIPVGAALGLLIYWQLRRSAASERAQAAEKAGPDAPGANAEGFLLGLILIVVAMMFRSWYEVATRTFLPIWVQQSGGSVEQGAQVLAILTFAVSAGSLIGGPIGDATSYGRVVLIAPLFAAGAHWFLMNSTGALQMAALIVIGMSLGATYPTAIVMAVRAWPRQVGMAAGLLMGLGWWPGGLGAQLTGWMASRTTLTEALGMLGIAPILATACIAFYYVARNVHMRRAAERRVDTAPADML